MFDSGAGFEERLEAALGDRHALLHLAGDTHEESKAAGCRKLVVAAAWADAHATVDQGSEDAMNRERLLAMAPSGCPAVAETAPTSLALAFQTSISGARGLIVDALNLRHRLPRTWARVLAGEVHAWKARGLAQSTAHVNPAIADEVDRCLADQLELMSWRRFEKLVDATLLHADEKTYRARAEAAESAKEVWATESSQGLRTLIARAAAGDVTVFLAAVNRIADALADDGDEDPIGARRAKALSVLAYPDRALDLLLRHEGDADPHLEPWRHTFAVDPDAVGGREPYDPNDPWQLGAPPAGWQSEEYGNYFQPNPDDPDYRASLTEPVEEPPEDPAVDPVMDRVEATDADPDTPPARRYANTGGINLPAALAAFTTLGGATLARLLEKARPKVVLTLHLSDQAIGGGAIRGLGRGVVRTDDGPITVDQLRRFLGDTAGDIVVRPVLDPASIAPSDAYEVPPRMRRAIQIRHPGSVFPLSPCSSSAMDLDHTIPYHRAHRGHGPPGQTRLGNLGPLARGEHRARTHGDLQVRQPDPGTYAWRTPEGWISLTTNQGSLILRDTAFTEQIWRAAKAPLLCAV